MTVGDSFLMEYPRGGPKHLFFVISKMEPDKVLLASVSTIREGLVCDSSCVLRAGDHPFIKHDSCIVYANLVYALDEYIEKQISQGICRAQPAASPGLISRIRQSGLSSPSIAGKWKKTPALKEPAMKWITRSHVHVDRVACPWLISRFVDSGAEFLFVPAGEVDRVARETGAVPFDAPGVELGHHDGRCSFEAIVAKYGLKDPALLRLARIVHAADVVQDADTDPVARGLEAIAVGFGVRYPDDAENLRRQFEVYDALYAWCRLDVAAKRT